MLVFKSSAYCSVFLFPKSSPSKQNDSPLQKTEAEVVNVSTGNKSSFGTLTAEEPEAKKREFFAKPEVKEMSAGLEEIAEAVAVAVEDKELRDRIYAKCMEKFDGETNVLWQQLEGDNNLRAKGGWNNRIDDQSDILGAATISFDDPVRSFYTYAPNFGLSW